MGISGGVSYRAPYCANIKAGTLRFGRRASIICPQDFHREIAICDFVQGCIGWLGAQLGREEVGMRELSLQEIEEQLFDKEMSIEEDMLDFFVAEESNEI